MVAISAGHWPKAKGAHDRDGFYEFEETLIWARRIHDIYRRDYSPKVFLVPAEDLGTKVKLINQVEPLLAVEIHFNSCPGGGAVGSETLYCPGSAKGKVVAERVQRALGAVMGPDRGAKEGWYRMDRPGIQDFPGDKEGDEVPDYFLRATTCPAIIVEPEFIQNKAAIHGGWEESCQALAKALHEAVLWLSPESSLQFQGGTYA